MPTNGTDTSDAAAASLTGKTAAIRARILDWLRRFPTSGATCDEIEEDFKLKHQTASARLFELRRDGLIRDSGSRRATRSGRNAIVWTAA